MKLTIDERWRWLAMDSDGTWYLFEQSPLRLTRVWVISDGIMEEARPLSIPSATHWTQSLHQRVGDEWEPVK